jgi:hypothetical protein
MRCFYHGNDLDGKCSAAIVKYKHPECELIPIDYGQDYPWNSISKDEEIYMVDFSIQPFDWMLELPDTLVWIDHHDTSIKEASDRNFDPLGIRDTSKAACELTWEYLFPDEMVPLAVILLGRYDVWDLHWSGRGCTSTDLKSFQYGMRGRDNNPEDPVWNVLFNFTYIRDSNTFVRYIIDRGHAIYTYLKKDHKKYAEGFSFETVLDGHTCICCNRGVVNSELLRSVWDEKRHDMMITFCRTPDKLWNVSLYTTHDGVNCGKIAQKYGGGGHRGAAGFKCKTLPFEI